MYVIFDTFNRKVISRHLSVDAAVQANARFQRSVKRSNGAGSYIPVSLRTEQDGQLVELDPDSVDAESWLVGDCCS